MTDPSPGFGEAGLSLCEAEQIHLAASIQPHGALLVVREPDLVILQASANAAAMLGVADPLPGRRLAEIGGLVQAIRPWLEAPLDQIPAVAGWRNGALDVTLHRPPAGGLVLEIERAGPDLDAAALVARGMQAFVAAPSLQALCEEAARVFRDLTGHDRVMIYRFDEEGHGEVFAEQKRHDLDPYLGNRYPASDIPRIARRLYERNRVRVVADVGYAPVPIEPRLNPATGADLDMSLCVLRSISPIHVQYLKNMEVGASLVASIMVGGRLWGLVACHHATPRRAPSRLRVLTEVLAEALGTRIAALESFEQAQAELAVRRLEQRLIQAISREGDWRGALFDPQQALLAPLGATGAALLFDGEVRTAGEVPATADLREIGRWLDSRPRAPVVHTVSLGAEEPRFARLLPAACGVAAAPLSTAPGEWLVWFRPEAVRTVTWGGDPRKPMQNPDDPARISPRASFAAWQELVEGSALPWTPRDLATARLFGETVTDVVLQFRAVRMLIAEDQLEAVRRQLRHAAQPVVLADPHGAVQMANAALLRLLPPELAAAGPRHMEDLLPVLADPEEARRRLREVLIHRRSWRGELRIVTAEGERALLLRADPVPAGPDRVLGFVFLFTDLAERNAAAAARRRFQEGMAEGSGAGEPQAELHPALRGLLASVVENAQLAALEIADGVDVARMPDMLDSVRASVHRMSELLEQLMRQSGRRPRDGA